MGAKSVPFPMPTCPLMAFLYSSLVLLNVSAWSMALESQGGGMAEVFRSDSRNHLFWSLGCRIKR